jgi:hypothetical protein
LSRAAAAGLRRRWFSAGSCAFIARVRRAATDNLRVVEQAALRGSRNRSCPDVDRRGQFEAASGDGGFVFRPKFCAMRVRPDVRDYAASTNAGKSGMVETEQGKAAMSAKFPDMGGKVYVDAADAAEAANKVL